MKLYWKIIFLTLILLQTNLQAQDEKDRLIDNQLWLDYYNYYNFKPDWQFYGDAGARTVLDKWSWLMVYGRPSVRWKKHKLWEIHGGLGVFFTINVDTTNTLEVRPWQGVRINWPGWKPIKFNHYFRIEERLNFLTDNWILEANLRFRYQLGLNILLVTFKDESNLFLPAYFELFFDVGQQISEQFSNRTRLGAGVGYKMNKIWTFEFHFVAQLSRTGEDDQFQTSDRLFQLKVQRFLFNKDYKSRLKSDGNVGNR